MIINWYTVIDVDYFLLYFINFHAGSAVTQQEWDVKHPIVNPVLFIV